MNRQNVEWNTAEGDSQEPTLGPYVMLPKSLRWGSGEG